MNRVTWTRRCPITPRAKGADLCAQLRAMQPGEILKVPAREHSRAVVGNQVHRLNEGEPPGSYWRSFKGPYFTEVHRIVAETVLWAFPGAQGSVILYGDAARRNFVACVFAGPEQERLWTEGYLTSALTGWEARRYKVERAPDLSTGSRTVA